MTTRETWDNVCECCKRRLNENEPRMVCMDCRWANVCCQTPRCMGKWAHRNHLHALDFACLSELEQLVPCGADDAVYHRIRGAAQAFANRPCWASITSSLTDDLEYNTFSDQFRIIQVVAGGLIAASARREQPTVVVLSTEDRRCFHTLEMACLFARKKRKIVSCGVPPDWGNDMWIEAVESVRPAVIVVGKLDGARLEQLAARLPSVPVISWLDCRTPLIWPKFHYETPTRDGCTHVSLPLDAVLITFSSGSTGRPKGIVQGRQSVLADFYSSRRAPPVVRVSYLAPAWMSDKWSVWSTWMSGGRLAFHGCGMSVWTSFQIARPTSLLLLPIMAQQLRLQYEALLKQSLQTTGEHSQHPAAGCVARAAHAMFQLLGDRCHSIAVGGSSVSPDLIWFLKRILPVDVYESYGTTETGGITSNGRVSSSVHVKLVDLPDMGFTSADTPQPRGEICVRPVLPGMLPLAWLNADAMPMSDDGYYRTGDIGAWEEEEEGGEGTVPRGERRLQVIGRVTDVCKLSNGYAVTPSAIEHVILTGLSVHGVKTVVVFPTADNNALAAVLHVSVDTTALGRDDVNFWLAAIENLCTEASLQPFEVPCCVVTDTSQWTVSSGLLTASGKVNRAAVRAAFLSRVHADPFKTGSTAAAAAGATGAAEDALPAWVKPRWNLDETLANNGVTSMEMPIIADALAKCGVYLTIDNWYLRSVRELIQESTGKPECKTLPAENVCEPVAPAPIEPAACSNGVQCLDADRCLQRDGFEFSAGDVDGAETKGSAVLVTGGTGFLGRTLVSTLLQKYADSVMESHVLVICMVRAKNHAEALARMVDALMLTHPGWQADGCIPPMELAHLMVIPCSTGIEDEHVWKQALAEHATVLRTVFVVYHVAATVKMLDPVLGYPLLRPANVVGTANVLKFLMAFPFSKRPLLVHASTVSALETLLVEVIENANDLASLASDAYSLTKGVAEHLVKQYQDTMKFSARPAVVIARLPLLTWNTSTGDENPSDWLVQVCRACLAMGVRPECTRFELCQSPISHMSVDECAVLLAGLMPFPLPAVEDGVPSLPFVLTPKWFFEQGVLRSTYFGEFMTCLCKESVNDAAWTYAVFHDPATRMIAMNPRYLQLTVNTSTSQADAPIHIPKLHAFPGLEKWLKRVK